MTLPPGTHPNGAAPDTDADTEERGLSADVRVLALIPHFECRDWLAGTIESVLTQTRPVDGIVVIDDASDDPPVDIVAAYPQVTLVHAHENVGPYRLVQQVIDATDHEAILFQDADDWSMPDRVERLLAASARTGAELVGSDYMLFDTFRWSAQPVRFPLDANHALTQRPTGHAQQHPSGLVARSLIDRVGGYATGMRFSGDDEFLRRAAYVAKVVNVPRILYYRRHRSESLTTSSATGHGTPARRAVLAEMSERAYVNVADAAAGRDPDLTPLRSRDPVGLTHLSGPSIDELNATSIATVEGRRQLRLRAPDLTARPSHGDHVPAPVAVQILVVGAPGAGADAVAAALGQHRSIAFAGDVTWSAAYGRALEQAMAVAEPTGTVMVEGTRPGTELDGLALDQPAGARLVAGTIDTMILGGGLPSADDRTGGHPSDADVLAEIARAPLTGHRRWVGTAPADRATITSLLAVFPDAAIVHVVRDVDEVAALGGEDGTIAPADAARAWQAGVSTGLDLETSLGDRVQRVRLSDVAADPLTVLDRCLEHLGADFDPAVARPFLPPTPRRQPEWHPDVTTADRHLSIALVGTTGGGVGLDALRLPVADAPEVPSHADASPPGRSGPNGGERTSQQGPTGSPARRMRRRNRIHPSVPAAVDLVDAHVPATDTVAVVSRGDDALLRFRADGLHLPATADGRYAGHHPADDGEVLAQLAAARSRGADWLLVPVTSAWWFDHYKGFAEHLDRHARRSAEADGHVLFALDDPPTEQTDGAGHEVSTPQVSTPRRQGRRPKVNVVSWSASHNPLGRTHLLAQMLSRNFDVDIVGATFDRFGGGIWPPLQDADPPVRTFPGGSLTDMLPTMETFASTLDGDAIVVSKPRFPGYGLAMLATCARRRPVILDVDDHELAFVGADTPLGLDDMVRLGDNPALDNPFGGTWTRYCDGLIGAADALTVSNAVLQARYGGVIIGHGRDETVFDPTRVDRGAVRRSLGFDPADRILLFGGTARRHKGIVDAAASLRRIGDPSLKLCLIETPELDEEVADDLAEYADHICTVPTRPMDEMPALLAAADAVCVLSDPTSPVAAYQIPAKVTDALAMGTPCLVRRVRPLDELIDHGVLTVVDDDLDDAIVELLTGTEGQDRAAAGRAVFDEQLSYAALAPRLAEIVEAQLDTTTPVPPSFTETVDLARRVAGRRSAPPDPVLSERPVPVAAATERVAGPEVPGVYDVVVFWKQNDTGLYDRRHDMVIDQLARSPRIRRVVQFDHPIGITTLDAMASDGDLSHGRLVAEITRARLDGAADTPAVVRRTFVYENRHRDDPGRIADPHPARDDHLAFVTDTLAGVGVGDGGVPVVAWGYPKHFDLPALIEAIGPDLVVSDVVDDHRTWHADGPHHDEIFDHYAEVLALTDLTLTNCAPMTAEMEQLTDNVHLVPNGCDWPPRPPGPRPAELDGMDGPIVGYVGNLSSRIDVDLLDHLARTHRDWNLVFVGSTHAGRDVLALDVHDNVHFVGPRPAEAARAFVDAFDVAIIPHTDDDMTRRMHPLKAFVYCAAGVPVVSTAVGNLGDLAPLISVADMPDTFVGAVENALGRGRRVDEASRDLLAAHAWTARMADIERLLDDAWRRRHPGWRPAPEPVSDPTSNLIARS